MRIPLDGNPYSTVGFNEQASYGRHEGEDLNLPGNDCGSKVHAIYKGEIVYASASDKDYGNLVVQKIEGEWGVRYVRYCHLDVMYVNTGSIISEGEVIGLMGTSGNSTSCHLHFDILIAKPSTWRFYSQKVTEFFENPLVFINKWSSIIQKEEDMIFTDQTKIPLLDNMEIQQIRSILSDLNRDLDNYKRINTEQAFQMEQLRKELKQCHDMPTTSSETPKTPQSPLGRILYQLANAFG